MKFKHVRLFNKRMLPTLLLSFVLALVQATPVDLTLLTFPDGSRTDVPVSADGEVEVRREETLSRLRVRMGQAESLAALDPRMRAYVVWAVSPEGDFYNLGELEIDGRRAELQTTTALQRFGILITAEPHFMVDSPNSLVVARSGTPRDEDIRVDFFNVELNVNDYSAISLPPQGSLPARVTQARMAFRVAESRQAAEFAPTELRTARVALDSMEELLRRNMPMEVLVPYINDTIRLSARATRLSAVQRVQSDLERATRRVRMLENQNQQLQEEVGGLDQRQGQLENRLNELQAEIQAERSSNRTLGLENEAAQRQVRLLEDEVSRLSDPWLAVRNALMRGVGARETAQGLAVTIGDSYFDDGDLEQEGREFLARIAGILSVDDPLDIRIEGHASASGPASRSLTLSESRATTVRTFLIDQGVAEDDISAEGFGTERPLVPSEDRESQSLNDRVEIVFRGIRNR